MTTNGTKTGEEFFEEFQIFFARNKRDTLLCVLGGHFAEIGWIKEDQIRSLFSLDGPKQPFWIPLVRFDFLPCFRSIDEIKRPAFSSKSKTHVWDNATTGHWIENKVCLLCKVKEGMGDRLGRDLPGPARLA
jgi:hypothetical protein